MPPTDIIYWDSCIFIAWLKDEKRPGNEMDGVYECVEDVEKGKIRLITSVMTRTEVLEANLTDEVRNKYVNLLKRRNVQSIDQDLRVADLSRKIREYYNEQKKIDGLPGISSPDAIHLATAVHYRATAFYTFDDGKKGSRGLLSLDGNVAGFPLAVCKPRIRQYRLRFNMNGTS